MIMKNIKNIILNIIIVLLLTVMAFSGYKLFVIKQDADKSADQYDNLEQIIQNETPPEDKPLTAAEKYQPVYDMNNDFIGWIHIPDTPLDYPVMQTKDSPEYYLRRDFDKKYSSYGVPFMDFKCTADQSDMIIIYSHNMMNKTMFSTVESYAKKSYWEEHKYVGFDTMNGYGTYEIAICVRIDLANTDFNYIDIVDFTTEQQFDEYIDKAKSLTTYDTGVNLEFGDKLLLLSTCEYQYENGRYFIIAKKISDEDIRTTIKE